MSIIGKKIVVLLQKYESDAYTDQMGRHHGGYVVLEEAELTVIETKDVPDTWTKQIVRDGGWKAVDKNGRIFLNNWMDFPSDSFMPRAYWSMEGRTQASLLNGMWYNATDCKIDPLVTPDRQPFVSAYLTECKEHRGTFFFSDESCSFCDEEAAT